MVINAKDLSRLNCPMNVDAKTAVAMAAESAKIVRTM